MLFLASNSSCFMVFWATITSNGLPYGTGPLSRLSVTLVYCGQMVGWIKMPLGTEIDLGPGDIVRWEPISLHGKGHSTLHPLFSPCLLWSNGCLSQQLLSSCSKGLLVVECQLWYYAQWYLVLCSFFCFEVPCFVSGYCQWGAVINHPIPA